MRARGAGRDSANRVPTNAATASATQAGQVTCRNPESAMSARVSSGSDSFAWLYTCTTCGTT